MDIPRQREAAKGIISNVDCARVFMNAPAQRFIVSHNIISLKITFFHGLLFKLGKTPYFSIPVKLV